MVDAAVGATRLTACKAPSLVRLAATANPTVTLTLTLVDASAPPAVACFAVLAAAVAASYRSCRQTRQYRVALSRGTPKTNDRRTSLCPSTTDRYTSLCPKPNDTRTDFSYLDFSAALLKQPLLCPTQVPEPLLILPSMLLEHCCPCHAEVEDKSTAPLPGGGLPPPVEPSTPGSESRPQPKAGRAAAPGTPSAVSALKAAGKAGKVKE